MDLRPVKAATSSEAWPMPNLGAEIADFAGKKCFTTMDFVMPTGKFHWKKSGRKLPEYHCTGSVHIQKSSPRARKCCSTFPSIRTAMFSKHAEGVKSWIDDFIVFPNDVGKLLEHVEAFLLTCNEHSLKISVKKCQFFSGKGKMVWKDNR